MPQGTRQQTARVLEFSRVLPSQDLPTIELLLLFKFILPKLGAGEFLGSKCHPRDGRIKSMNSLPVFSSKGESSSGRVF